MGALQSENVVDYVDIVVGEGYTEREARFLVFAAEHSGYFTIGHFRRYAGLKAGKTSQNFIERVMDKAHAATVKTKSKSIVLLKSTHRLNEMLDLPEPRLDVRVRLQCLDFAMAYSHLDYMVREADKLVYFVDVLGVSERVLSMRNGHYFDERMPIYRLRKGAGFVYVDSGTLDGWESFLERYAPLFASLKKVYLVFATTSRDERRGIKTFESKAHRMDTNRKELKVLEGVPIKLLGGPELQRLKRLREEIADLNVVEHLELEQYRLGQRYGFVF